MSEFGTARAQISAMLASLQTIEGQLARGDVRGQGLEDLKMGVDDMRLRMEQFTKSQQPSEPQPA